MRNASPEQIVCVVSLLTTQTYLRTGFLCLFPGYCLHMSLFVPSYRVLSSFYQAFMPFCIGHESFHFYISAKNPGTLSMDFQIVPSLLVYICLLYIFCATNKGTLPYFLYSVPRAHVSFPTRSILLSILPI